MALETSGLSGAALKRAIAYNKAMEKAEKSLQKQEKLVNQLTGRFSMIDGGAFFRDLTAGEIAAKTQQLNEELKKLQTDAKSKGVELTGEFSKMADKLNLASMKQGEIRDKLGLSDEAAKKLKDSFSETEGYTGNISQFIQEMGPDAEGFLDSIIDSEELSADMKKSFFDIHEDIQEINVESLGVQENLKNVNETTFSIASGFQAMGDNLKKGILDRLFEFDTAIKKSQMETGINFSQNTTQMAMLTSETAKFGMSVEGTAEMMGDLSTTLRTTNFDVLAGAAEDLAAMQKATGLASKDVALIAKEFIKFGKTSKDVQEFSQETMQMSVAYGLSGKAVMEDMAASLSKMRTMGFVGGEQSLRRMVLESKRLGMNVDEIFNSAKKARNIEGAMEMAADLQLAGGSFAAINPMDLLSAARKGPEEMRKILGEMGSDIGSWVKDKDGNDVYQFDPVDADRLQMVADATGLELDSLTNMISQNAEDVKKADLLGGLGGSIDGLNDEEKAFLMQMTKIGENGQLQIAGEMEGIDDLSQVNQKTIEAAMAAEKEKQDSLEKQAQQNQSLEESWTSFMNSIMNAFTVFQPILEFLGDMVQGLNNSMGGFGKFVAGVGIMLGGALFSAAKWILQGINLAKGFQIGTMKGGLLKRMGAVAKSAAGFRPGGAGGGAKDIAKTGSQAGQAGGAGAGAGGGLKGLAKGLKAMGDKKVFKGIAAMALLAPVMVLFLPAIPGLLVLTAIGAVAPLLVAAFRALKTGFSMMGKNISNIVKGSIAMAIMGIALIPFAYAAMMMGQVDWLNVLAGVGIAMLVVILLTALGFALMFGLPWLLLGAFGLMIAGIALLVAAVTMGAAGQYLAMAVEPLQAIADADWTVLLPFADVISEFGFGMVWGALGLLAGAVALYFAAPLLAASVAPLKEIADTDWEPLKQFADALSYVGPAMLGFALAGLLLLNPWMLLGIFVMLTSLSTLSFLMRSLAPNLSEGADGIERMADGVVALDKAVSSLDIEKLSKLRNIALSIGWSGRAMENMVKALSKLDNAGGGGGGKTVHVVQLELDGKKIKEIILKDTEHQK